MYRVAPSRDHDGMDEILAWSLQPEGPGTDPSSMLPVVVWLSDVDEPGDVVDALALTAFATGRQCWSRSVELDRVRPEASLLPAGVAPLRAAAARCRCAGARRQAGQREWLDAARDPLA